MNARVGVARAKGRAVPARVARGLALVRAARGLAVADREVVDPVVVDPADHPRPSGLSSMPWSLMPMAMASSTVVS